MTWVALISEWLPTILSILGVGTAGTAGVPLFKRIFGWLDRKNIKSDQDQDNGIRSFLDQVLSNAATLAVARRQTAGQPVDTPLTEKDLTPATTYVTSVAADSLAHLNVNPRDIPDMILARFGRMLLDRVSKPAA